MSLGVPAENAAALSSYDVCVTPADRPRRDLTQAELEELVAGVAQDPAVWAERVAFDKDERVYVSLLRDSYVDVWLLCWTPESDTGWHDHDVSSGAVAVVAGELVENNLTLTDGAHETRVPAGKVLSFGPDHIHRLNGAVQGSISYADELGPID